MPVMDGYEATHEIRNSEKEDAKSIPIIAMTANAFDDDMKKSKTAGMGAHLSKPLAIYHPSSTPRPRLVHGNVKCGRVQYICIEIEMI